MVKYLSDFTKICLINKSDLFKNESKNQLSILYHTQKDIVTPLDIFDYYLHYDYLNGMVQHGLICQEMDTTRISMVHHRLVC